MITTAIRKLVEAILLYVDVPFFWLLVYKANLNLIRISKTHYHVDTTFENEAILKKTKVISYIGIVPIFTFDQFLVSLLLIVVEILIDYPNIS